MMEELPTGGKAGTAMAAMAAVSKPNAATMAAAETTDPETETIGQTSGPDPLIEQMTEAVRINATGDGHVEALRKIMSSKITAPWVPDTPR